ncbi:MAG: chemotaxis protein CheC [Lachnospiraceae bacterium]|nr:chemotaxis protein CheC [Lachnospiraceae bacterium]
MSNNEIFETLKNDNVRFDILREVGNIGAGNATTALAQLINSKIDMTVPKVDLLTFSELSDVVGSAEKLVVGILVNLSGDIDGMMMFMLDYTAAHYLVNCIIGKEKENMEAFTEMDFSALKEIGNIIAGAYLSALSTLMNLKIKESIPYMSIDMAGAVLSVPAIAFGELGDRALLIQSEFGQSDNNVRGFFILIPTEESYGKIMSSLGV